jgi:hypothetical protein
MDWREAPEQKRMAIGWHKAWRLFAVALNALVGRPSFSLSDYYSFERVLLRRNQTNQ